MIKTLLITLSILTFSSAVDIDYKALEQNKANVDNYAHLLNVKGEDYSHLIKKKPKIEKQLDSTEKIYTGSKFITKSEFKSINKKVQYATKLANKKREFIMFFTSQTVPSSTMFNIMYQTGILQDNGVDIITKQYYIGFGDNFKDYMFNMKDEVAKKTFQEKEKIVRNSKIKVDPNLFEFFKIKKVPAIALAECIGLNPTIENCEFKYLLHGDASLLTFFDKIKDKNVRYEKYYDYLLANKFDKDGKLE